MRVFVAALLLAGIFAAASTAQAPVRASALAVVLAGSAEAAGDVLVTETGTSRGEVEDVAQPGVSIAQGEALARSTPLRDGGVRVKAAAVARTVSVLDGLVQAYGVRRTVIEDAGQRTRRGRVEGLRIGGQNLGDITESASYDLPDHSGRVIVNNGTVGLRVLLERAAYGYPAGTDIRVAVVRTEVAADEAPALEEELEPTPTATPKPRRRSAARKARRAERARRLASARARLMRDGFTFPIFGDAAASDDFGGPRQIGPHQGNDIFAPFGAPVLAVADGIISKVGTLPISGNRLWLTTADGDAFFYAHLSAFSPAAVNGAQVRAGTVLGFTGNTGDAEPTPPHVHFEIHPNGRVALDPHTILQAWQGRGNVSGSAWLQQYGADTAERPGALVEVKDFIAGE